MTSILFFNHFIFVFIILKERAGSSSAQKTRRFILIKRDIAVIFLLCIVIEKMLAKLAAFV